MRQQLGEEWKKNMREEIMKLKEPGAEKFEIRTPHAIVKQFIIMRLSGNNIPFQCRNLGAGVSVITTDIKNCPMCKKPLKA